MTSPVLLGGIDVFHLMNHRAMRSSGLDGNHCLFVVEVANQFELSHLQQRLHHAVTVVPELQWRLDPAAPWPLSRPRWSVDPRHKIPLVTLHDVSSETEISSKLCALLARPLDGQTPWAVDILRRPHAGDTLVFGHFHPLVDAKGVDRLVSWLGSGIHHTPAPPPPGEQRFRASEHALQALDRNARLSLARAYRKYMLELGRHPIVSFATANKVDPKPGVRFVRLVLSVDETRAFDVRVRKRAKLAETNLMLLATARVVDRALAARGHAPARIVAPVPLSLDPKGEASRLFGNYLTMMFMSLGRNELANETLGLAHLAEQQRTVVRDKLDLGMIAALDLGRWLPTPVYRWLLDQPFRGEMASFVFSNPGKVTLERFAGLPVVNAYPLPSVVSPPGFQVIFSRFGNRLSASMMAIEGLVTEAEWAAMPNALKADLLGEGDDAT